MTRIQTPLITGETYHVFNRGVDKRIIYNDTYDYLRFYQSLDLFNSVEPIQTFKYAKTKSESGMCRKKLVDIQAYSLLPNHYHLIIKQSADGGIGEFLRRVGAGYTSYFNERNKRSGSLFQGTFKRVHINNQSQYQYLFAYVNENHFVHEFDISRDLYQTSSLHYQGKRQSKLIETINSISQPYLFEENVRIAKDIYNKRENIKDLFE